MLHLINSTTGKPYYENTFYFDINTARVTVHDTSRLIKNWELYIIAKTTKKTSPDYAYNFLLSVHRGPNFAPRFWGAAPIIIINIADYPSANSYYSYKISKYFDQNPFQSVKLSAHGLDKSWMNFDAASERIYFENLDMDKLGRYSFNLALTDDDFETPATSNYTWSVQVVCWNTRYYNRCPPNYTEPVIEEEKVEIIQPVVKYNELYANITSLTSTGLLTI